MRSTCYNELKKKGLIPDATMTSEARSENLTRFVLELVG